MARFVRFSLLMGILTVSIPVLAAEPLPTIGRMDKKLIEYGWDVPTPDFIRANIAEMEKLPFDGVIFRPKAGSNALDPKPWDEAAFAEDFDNAANIAWERFSDNFVQMLVSSDQDWFDDAQWQAIEHNVQILAKLAKLSRCAGICFDPEPYGINPWEYQKLPHRETKCFAEYQAKVRERGGQFIRALQKEFPGARILTFYLFGMWKGRYLCGPLDPEERMKALSQESYALYPAFSNGMLDAMDKDAVIVDGNEHSYYYTDVCEYLAAYQFVQQGARYLIDPSLWNRYRTSVQSGQALYLDYYFSLRENKDPGTFLSPEDRSKWFEHNVYNALNTADEYVWCYSEHMNWWKGPIPPGAIDAIKSAREKIQNRDPLGFDIKPFIVPAVEKMKQEKEKKKG
jgi:hypothetical protein